MGDADLVIPQVDNSLQPLAAIYSLQVLPAAQKLLASGERGPKALATQVKTRILSEKELAKQDPKFRWLRSIDTPEEFEALQRELGS